MHNSPFISIITVVKNDSSGLQKTLESVIEQDFNNYEYIIIDGASNDSTVDVIKNYESSINYWISESDNGIYDAMNKGISVAKGKWIHLLNASDYYVDSSVLDKVSRLLTFPEKFFYYFTLKRIIGEREEFYGWEYRPWKLWYSCCIPQPTMFVSKNAYDQVGLFNTRYKIGADHDMTIRLIKSGLHPIFTDIPTTAMPYGGASTLNITESFNEFRKMTVNNGLNGSLAYFFYLVKVIKYQLFIAKKYNV